MPSPADATMLPGIDFIFAHAPIESGVAVRREAFSFPWLADIEKFPIYDARINAMIARDSYPRSWSEADRRNWPRPEWRDRQKRLFSACFQAYNPWSGVARELRKRLDRGAPITNAFCKMYEICFLDEVRAVLHDHGERCATLQATFLAEAPALFPIAVMYYLGNRFPMFLALDKFRYNCTTLPLDSGTGSALPDQYSLISANIEHWHFMDHTSSRDTREMLSKLGSGTQDMVTGDIGKPTVSWKSSERELHREELGQLVSACALLKDGGLAILKMFTAREYGTACMLRLAMGVFKQVRVMKPLTSRSNNLETYWILSGFKRKLFEPLLDPLLAVLDDAAEKHLEAQTKYAEYAVSAPEKLVPVYSGFLDPRNFSHGFPDQLYRLTVCQHLRYRAFLRQGAIEFRKQWDTLEDPFAVQIAIMRALFPMIKPYTVQWLATFPIDKLGETFYHVSNLPPPDQPARAGIICMSGDDTRAEYAEQTEKDNFSEV